MARPSDYRTGYRKNTRDSEKKENKFYTKANNGDILNKRLPGIDEIKQNIEAEQARAHEYENEWLDSVVNNADEKQTKAAKARAQEAKNIVKDWNEKLSEAYGLGENGYWNRGTSQPETQQSAQMKANPAHAYAAGNGRPAQTATTRSTPEQSKTQQSAQMKANPAHAYGIGQFGTKAKPTIVPGAAGSAKSRQIMQLQDTLVHNPGMSDREKNQVQEKISSLTADKKVLDWKDANPGTPTVESYEAQKSYYDRLWQQNQDAIVNGLGNGTLKQGSDEWYELFKKGDNLLAMKDAYNRGMMGQLDGEKAQAADEQAATVGEDGRSANDQTVSTPGMDDGEEENHTTGDSNEDTKSEQSDLDTVKDLMKKIRQYMTDMRDPYMKEEVFAEKYNNGEIINTWSNELKELIDEDYYNEFISIYDDWEIPEKIDTPEEVIAEQNGDLDLTDNGSNIISNIFDTVGNVGKGVYDSVTGGIKWVQDNAEQINDFLLEIAKATEAKRKAEEAEKKRRMGALEGDYALIAPALDSMVKILDELGDRKTKTYINDLLEDMLNGEKFDIKVIGQESIQSSLFGNDIYWEDFEDQHGIRTEMEVLTEATKNTYNGSETMDSIVKDLLELFLPSGETDIYTDLLLYNLEEIVDGLKEQNNPGIILQEGDVRIMTQPFAGLVETHCFFRGNEFLYSVDAETCIVTYGNNYDSILAEMIQNSINQP